MNNLTQIRQLTDKAQRLAKNNSFVIFAPLREMLLAIQGLFHSFFWPEPSWDVPSCPRNSVPFVTFPCKLHLCG